MRPAPPKVRRGRGLVVAGTVMLLVAVWAIGTVALGLLAQIDASCTSCHAMRLYADAMAATQHRTVGCVQCHRAGGPLGVFVDGMAMGRRVSAALIGREPSGLGAVDDRTCRSCHMQALTQTITSDSISVRHSDFSQTSCSECHGGTGHVLPERHYAATHMDDCLNCHRTNATNLDSCRLCHVGGSSSPKDRRLTAWRVTHGPTWEKTHGAGDLDTCGSCHPSDYCVRCHDTRVPHAPAWSREHGARAAADGSESCLTCHDPDWCDRCHGVAMPHPEGYMAQHPSTTAAITDPKCMRCHEVEVCQDCHLRSAHPAVPGVDFRHVPGGS